MECKHIQEKIMQYIHHDLAGDEQSAFERHVRECSGCQEFVRQENEFTALLNEHITMSDTLPEGLRKSVEQMVQEYGTAEANEAPGVKWTWPQLFPALGVLSVIILVLCVTVPQK